MKEENKPYFEVTKFHKTNQPHGLWKTGYLILNIFQFLSILFFPTVPEMERGCSSTWICIIKSLDLREKR